MSDSEIILFADVYMDTLIHKLNGVWYWCPTPIAPMRQAASLRDAVLKANEALKG
jgi:hypothetical protein